MPEKSYGTPYEFSNPTMIAPDGPYPNNAVIGAWVYQTTPTVISNDNYLEFNSGDMNLFVNSIEKNCNVKLLYARISFNATRKDENYLDMTDMTVGIVFQAKDGLHSPAGAIQGALGATWFLNIWYAGNMQNAPVEAWILGYVMSTYTKLLYIGIAASVAVGVGITGYYLYKRRKPKQPPLPVQHYDVAPVMY